MPLHPILLELLTIWRAWAAPRRHRAAHHQQRPTPQPLLRRPIVARCARIAGIGHVHPHQLRHTLATQAVNYGMNLEAIAVLLGHRSMCMTLAYARIADRTVADQYYAATEQVEALYAQPLQHHRHKGRTARAPTTFRSSL